jgi:MFS family permease
MPAVSTDTLFTRRFAALWFFQFATFFAAFQLFPVIPFRILALGGTKAEAGSFLFAYTLASATAAPIMGAIADHFGRKRMLIIASLLFIVFSLLYAIVSWLPLVLLVGVVHGSLWSGILSSAGAIMTDYIPPSRRTEGLAYWGLAPTAAIALAPMAGLFVYKHGGWLALCLDLAAISVLTSIWATRLPYAHVRRAENPRFHLKELWDWQVVRVSLSFTVVAFGYGGITSYVAILAHERQIQPESIFFTVFAIAVVVIRVSTSRLGDRFGPRILLYPSLVLMPIGLAILSMAFTRAQMITAAVFFGTGMGAGFPAFMTLLVGATDEHSRARTFGSVIWAFDTGIGIGSLAIGSIGQHRGLGTAFAISAGLSCLSIPIFLLTTRRFMRGIGVAENVSDAGNT